MSRVIPPFEWPAFQADVEAILELRQERCSLAELITPDDVRLLRQADAPVVTYVNTLAAVKAVSDICCTSTNARKIAESLGAARVITIPDEYLAKNAASRRECA